MKPNLIIAAGGTGGHIFPALAVAEQLSSEYKIIWVGSKAGMENQFVPKAGYLLETINIGGIRNKGFWRKLTLPWILLRAILQCIIIILRYKPKVIIGFGGYVTFPAGFAGRLLGLPVVIHEQNSVAGLTNRLLAKIASRILTAFPNVLISKKTTVIGNPVRREIASIYAQNSSKYQEGVDKLRVLIVGGSLGAKALNDIIPLALAKIPQRINKVIHQVGRSGNVNLLQQFYNTSAIQAQVVHFIEDMAAAYNSSDIIICRAGALTVAEIACANIVAIFVPFPFAVDDHQAANAAYLANNGAAILIRQSQLDQDKLLEILESLTMKTCRQMAEKAKKLAVPDSTLQICQQIKQLIKGKK